MVSAWAGGSTRRWRLLRVLVFQRDRQPDGTLRCTRCGRVVHRQCKPTGCTGCRHVHHLDGTRGRRPDHVPLHRLTTWCAGCNLEVGDPTANPTPAPPAPRPNPMAGVPHR